jgi:DNA invertase Pin-like site-specific DNA recombinase
VTDTTRSPKIRPWHLDRSAVVYVRQSTPQQVAGNQESAARQYALAGRAADLGWPRECVAVIDEDMGKSGQSIEGRPGFQRLLAEVALDRVGLILGLEMSRLARCCKDWHQLLELCGRYRVLLADADGVYDPTEYSDRLLLGLHGVMSEAELHVLKQRMYQGKLNKARRGEIFGTAPLGYVRSAGGLAIDPDEQVQAVVRLIFDQFDRQGTVHGLLRYLAENRIQVPVRPHSGPNRGQLEWRRPNRATLQNLLSHPAYAGAYRYGRRPTDSGRPTGPAERELVLIRDRLPAYITWDRFRANQERLAANRARLDAAGAPRGGPSLLAGLLRCGRCGRRMAVRYSGRRSVHWYACSSGVGDYGEPLCQSLSGPALDALAAEQILAAVAPAALEASVAAADDVERERAELTRHWQLRIERVRYEAGRADRQYRACEPENRLVARELERRWEEALRQQRQLEEQFADWQRSAPSRLSGQDRETLAALAEDLPAVWHAPTTTWADRQRVARLLLERVAVTVDKGSEHVDVRLHWLGGAAHDHALERPVRRYDLLADYPRLVERLKELCHQRLGSSEIAERLNGEGFRPPKRVNRFTAGMVLRLTTRLGIQRRRNGSPAGLGTDEHRPSGLARKLGVGRDAVRQWVRSGCVHARRDGDGHRVIWADADELRRLAELYALPRTAANRGRLAELKKPKPRPAR